MFVVKIRYAYNLHKDDEIIDLVHRVDLNSSGLYLDVGSSNLDGTFFPETICIKNARYVSVFDSLSNVLLYGIQVK